MKSVSLLPALGRDARLTMAMAAMFAVLGLFLAQAFRIQVVQGSRYRAMVESGMSKREVLRASRGRLLDRNGELLAGNAEYSFRAGGANGKRTAREMRRIHPWQSVGAVVLGNVNRDGVGTSGLEQMFTETYDKGFADSGEIASWARTAMYWAYYNALINGTGENTLSPKGTATRAQLAKILVNYVEKFQ